MQTSKPTGRDRLELVERGLLGLALAAGVVWAVSGGTPSMLVGLL